uniref:activator of 90 kDa heat shock protein ATPase homolog 1 n=1 Tax=Myxine glutinosa TaxID=7769 RepID=UPI00358EEE9E
MAKWGEGDPRWIVEERADATNVNNWHWTERDVSKWSEDLLRKLLLDVKVENAEGRCAVTEVTEIEGEASCNNRKGKLFFFYEWSIKISWEGTETTTGVKGEGTVKTPNLSEENRIEDVDIIVSSKQDHESTLLLQLMNTVGTEEIRNVFATYVTTMKSEFTQGMILSSQNAVSTEHGGFHADRVYQQTDGIAAPVVSKATTVGVKIPTCVVTLSEKFQACPEDLYQVFTREEMVQAFSRAPAVVKAEKGGQMLMLSGHVTGQFIELVENSRIVMKWRCRDWPDAHYAIVTLTFLDRTSETELRLECRGVPASEEEATRDGWRRYYFESIRRTFGFGASLF